MIAELQGRELARSAPSLPRQDAFPVRAGDSRPSRQENGNSAAAEARLEAIAARMEPRLAQLGKQLKQAQLIPMTREENEAEIQGAREGLAQVQERLNAGNAEVRRLAALLNVPDTVTNLSPMKRSTTRSINLTGSTSPRRFRWVIWRAT